MDENLRIDGADDFYKKTLKIDKILTVVFYINIIISFILLFDANDWLKKVLIIISISFSLVYVLLSALNDIVLKNMADNERRKLLINNSFNIKLSRRKTNKIYNNHEDPSKKRFILNNFESVFFTKNIFDKMIFQNTIKVIVTFCIYISSIIICSSINNLNLVLLITQTLFSSEIIIAYLKGMNYKITLDKIYNNFYNFLVVDKWNEKNEIILLDASIDYQCLLSYSKISLSSSLFKKMNPRLSKEWEEIENEISNNLKS